VSHMAPAPELGTVAGAACILVAVVSLALAHERFVATSHRCNANFNATYMEVIRIAVQNVDAHSSADRRWRPHASRPPS
jgi:hypothetical protein